MTREATGETSTDPNLARSAGPAERPARRARRAFASLAGRAAVLVLVAISILFTLAAFDPNLASLLLPDGADVLLKRLFFGSLASGAMTAAVFDIAAGLGLMSSHFARRALRLEERALGQARAASFRGIDLSLVRGGQSPFFAAGTSGIAGLKGSAVYAMSENILKDARNYRYEPIALIIDRVAPQIVAGSLDLRDAQQMGVRLGILGTFVGMTLALVQITRVFAASGDAAASQAAVGDVISSLSLGFGTSIAGLSAAILLQIVAWSLRGRENAVLGEMQEVAADMQTLCRKVEMSGSIGRHMDLLKDKLDEHRHGLTVQEAAIRETTIRMGEATERAAAAFARPLDGIEETSRGLSGLLAEQARAAAGLAEMTGSVGALQASVSEHMDRSLERANRLQAEAAEALRTEVRALAGAIAEEMRSGFAASRSLEGAAGIVAGLGRASTLLESAANAQRRSRRGTNALLAAGLVLLAALAVGLLLEERASSPQTPPVQSPAVMGRESRP